MEKLSDYPGVSLTCTSSMREDLSEISTGCVIMDGRYDKPFLILLSKHSQTLRSGALLWRSFTGVLSWTEGMSNCLQGILKHQKEKKFTSSMREDTRTSTWIKRARLSWWQSRG